MLFFGAPHNGLKFHGLETMVEVHRSEQRRNLVMQLKEGSEFVESQKEDLMKVWKDFTGKLISFFETAKPLQANEVITMPCTLPASRNI